MGQKVVLCIDDDIRDLEIQKEALELGGFRVIAVDDARVGLAMFMTNDVDVVLLDFNFPKTDGGIIADEMRRRKPAVPIAMVSGYMNEAVKSAPSVDLLFEKPVSAEELTSRIDIILKERAEQRARENDQYGSRSA